jgi:hypothetical protein
VASFDFSGDEHSGSATTVIVSVLYNEILKCRTCAWLKIMA